jgi:hypothetical protein
MTKLYSGADELRHRGQRRPQRRGGLAGHPRCACSCQLLEDRPVLLLKGRHHGPHRFHQPGPIRAVGPKAALAPEHPGPHGPAGGIVGRLDSWLPDARPPGLSPLEALPTRPCGVRDATGVAHIEQPLHRAPDRPPLAGNARVREGASADPRPPVGHWAGLYPQGCAALAGAAPARAHGFDVAPQLRPTQLPPPGGRPGIGAPSPKPPSTARPSAPGLCGDGAPVGSPPRCPAP